MNTVDAKEKIKNAFIWKNVIGDGEVDKAFWAQDMVPSFNNFIELSRINVPLLDDSKSITDESAADEIDDYSLNMLNNVLDTEELNEWLPDYLEVVSGILNKYLR